MAYEFNVYREFAKNLPKMGQKITTPEGKGKVINVNILKKYIYVDYGEGKIVKIDYTQPQPQTTLSVCMPDPIARMGIRISTASLQSRRSKSSRRIGIGRE